MSLAARSAVSVLVDTSVWSVALRRARPVPDRVVTELTALIVAGRVVMMGPIRQEILSGIRTEAQFDRVRDRLRAFPDLDLGVADYEDAAACFNQCRAAGIQGSNTDFLLCAVAMRRAYAIFTTDNDFAGFRRVLDVTLHEPG